MVGQYGCCSVRQALWQAHTNWSDGGRRSEVRSLAKALGSDTLGLDYDLDLIGTVIRAVQGSLHVLMFSNKPGNRARCTLVSHLNYVDIPQLLMRHRR